MADHTNLETKLGEVITRNRSMLAMVVTALPLGSVGTIACGTGASRSARRRGL
jgi:hypothetical protein